MTGRELVVGFDLDLTLLDARAGIAAVWDAVAARTGVSVDSAAAVRRLGQSLEREAARWFPPEQVPAVIELYGSFYPEIAVPGATLMPGADQSVAAVRRNGGRVVVFTAKHEPNAKLHLDALGLDVDDVVGDLGAADQATAFGECAGDIFVGDHVGDIVAARAAGAVPVGVAAGTSSASELADAGAAVVLGDLTQFPGWLEEHLLTVRLAELDRQLAVLGSVLVAFSGGADSAFVLAAAVRALGPDRVIAATAVSPSLPAQELDAAAEFAASLGVRHLTPSTDEMAREGYRANAGDRCYFCKAELLDVLGPTAEREGIAAIATGTNADDARAGFRPGIRAAFERGAVTPLRDAGFTKEQVRAASRRWELSTSDKPAAACLSSRVAYGITITPERLTRVDQAERAVREALAAEGNHVTNLRVRDLGETARIEVDPELVATATTSQRLHATVREVGFDTVEVDPRGFRSGSMNELLPNPERYR